MNIISMKLTDVIANALWKELGSYNLKVEHHFRQLSKLYEQDENLYKETLAACAKVQSTKWHTMTGPVAEEVVALVKDFNYVRTLLQKMSELSDVPIEPKEQTKLLDECLKVPGVAIAGVPGGKQILKLI